MKHKLSEQVKAIMELREILKNLIAGTETDSALNDAGSTIAALNLTKNLTSDNKEEYLSVLLEYTAAYHEANDPEKEKDILAIILAMTYDRIRELENDEKNGNEKK